MDSNKTIKKFPVPKDYFRDFSPIAPTVENAQATAVSDSIITNTHNHLPHSKGSTPQRE
jgi:hypothetical protein